MELRTLNSEKFELGANGVRAPGSLCAHCHLHPLLPLFTHRGFEKKAVIDAVRF